MKRLASKLVSITVQIDIILGVSQKPGCEFPRRLSAAYRDLVASYVALVSRLEPVRSPESNNASFESVSGVILHLPPGPAPSQVLLNAKIVNGIKEENSTPTSGASNVSMI